MAGGGVARESPFPGHVFRAWAPANEGAGRVTRAQAVELAEHFDLVVVSARESASHIAAMERVEPDPRLLVYVNAAFAQAGEGDTYPDSWYARDAHGSTIRSLGFGNWLMDVSEPGWIRDRARTCERLLTAAPYDGCMLDLLGTAPLLPGYATGIPINERTHDPWRDREWLDATSNIARAVGRRVAPAMIVGNGLGDGSRFFDPEAPSSVLLADVDGGIAESWLRSPKAELGSYPPPSEWLLDVEMLSSVEAAGGAALVLTKAWAEGTRSQKDRLHEFALASFLLGTEGDAFFYFSYAPRSAIRWHPWWAPDIGTAVERFAAVHGVYRRRFTRGLVLVNPSSEMRTLSLDRDFVDLRGRVVRSATLPPHTGLVLKG